MVYILVEPHYEVCYTFWPALQHLVVRRLKSPSLPPSASCTVLACCIAEMKPTSTVTQVGLYKAENCYSSIRLRTPRAMALVLGGDMHFVIHYTQVYFLEGYIQFRVV